MTYDFYGGAPVPSAAVRAPAATAPPAPRSRRPLVLAALAALVVLALLVVAVRVVGGPDDHRPVVLPDTLLGLPSLQGVDDFGQDPIWRGGREDELGDRPFGGRGFGVVRQSAVLNLVVARGGYTDGGDVSQAAGEMTRYGSVTCSSSLEIPDIEGLPDHQDRLLDSVQVCWRSTGSLTVSVLVLRLGRAESDLADVAAAVDAVWALNL